MKKLADISAFERLQGQSPNTVSDMAVFNTMENAERFVKSCDGLVDGLRELIKVDLEDTLGIDTFKPSYTHTDFIYDAGELCNWIEWGYDMTAFELTNALLPELGEDVEQLLDVTGENISVEDWVRERFADSLMTLAREEHGYRVKSGEYVADEDYTPEFL